MTASSSVERPLDLVVVGATSFVGAVVVRHLVEHPVGGLRWAIAGRNADKLARVAQETGAAALGVEQLIADAADLAALRAITERTRAVVSTVGPYALHGSPLVEACAAMGTDYLDLTGEPQWMRRMTDAHGDAAAASGARIVHACGFDSIPSDVGVAFLQKTSLERHGAPCVRVGMRVAGAKGGVSGGTVASLMNVVAEMSADPSLRKLLADPYALVPSGSAAGPRQPSVNRPMHDALSGQWIAPFVMAAINTKVVHRSHALLGRPWGEFRYDEAMLTGAGPLGAAKASAVAGAMGGFMGAALVPPVRRLLGRTVLPKPGSGPSAAAQEAGSWDLRFYGRTADERRVVVALRGDRDPGYGSTAKMLVAAATTLLRTDRRVTPGGCWTPSTAMGDALLDALCRDAGVTVEVLEP